MLSVIARLTLTSTAMAPVLLTYAWVAFKSDRLGIFAALIASCILLTWLCIQLFAYTKKNLERSKFNIISVEVADVENLSFLLLYLLPLFTSSFETLNWDFLIPAIITFGAVVATGYSYHFNPLLGLMGWHFYKVGTTEGVTYILVTKKQIRNVSDTVEIGQLTEYIVVDIGEIK
ncbi:TPA: hypothetical protein JBJ80_13370 [Legionella pneumophila]|nr:hypothetical protein [Legionella pneumophila]HAU1872259.1 hypothetical protein [Legionella pneumophila]